MPMPSVVRNVTFEMHDQNGELRIIRIDPPTPFVSRTATIDWLKTKLATQKDLVTGTRSKPQSRRSKLRTPAPRRPSKTHPSDLCGGDLNQQK